MPGKGRGVGMITVDLDDIVRAAPVQIAGTVNGVEWYFRARWDTWCFGIGSDACGVAMGWHEGFRRGGPHGMPGSADASWMDIDYALTLVYFCLQEYLAGGGIERD